MIPKIFLKPKRDKAVLRRHPWIYSGAVADIQGSPSAGETVQVLNSNKKFLCWAAYSPKSQISARVWSWDENDNIDYSFFYQKIEQAIKLREEIVEDTDALRLVYAESDGLPGLIIDRYKDTLVIQFLSAGIEFWKESIVKICSKMLNISSIVERSDVDVRRLEGLDEQVGLLFGKLSSDTVMIHEYENRFWVDLLNGHKTGFYLDQRENRNKISDLSAGRDVLDCFSYTGGFSIPVLRGGAGSLTCVETSSDAIELAKENISLNGLSENNVELIEGDVFNELRVMRDRNLSFDLVILDPPKFAPTKSTIAQASRGYKDINLLALKLLRPGGYLVTFSCSGAIGESLFQKIIADAAIDAGVEAQIIDRLHQSPDHPVALNFPEAAYLKGFIINKIR